MEAVKVAKALALDYYNNKGKPISPIKLQKILYFLYAFYGSYVKDMQANDSDVEMDVGNLPRSLFIPNFEAWRYGPVDPNVYREYRQSATTNFLNDAQGFDDLYKDNIVAQEVFKSITRQAYDLSDFSLVDISHQDKTWIDAFPNENQSMDSESIINEYAERRAAKVAAI